MRRRALREDDRGALMAVGAFMAIFQVGVLYLVASIGEAAVYQERLQDAADDAAFSAAVTHARAMNAIADVHATMVVSQAVMSGFDLAVVAAEVCKTFEVITQPPDFCDDLLRIHSENRDEVAPRLRRALREGSRTARRIAEAAPEIAGEEVASIVRARAGGIVRRAFLVSRPMAVGPGGNSSLCALANLHVFRLGRITLGVDMLHRILGEGSPQIGRDLPHCRPIDGVDAMVTTPPERPVGTEPFQVRVIVVGDARPLRAFGAGVRIPYRVSSSPGTLERRSWARSETMEEPTSTLVTAQAEYYSFWESANLLEDTESHSVEEDAFRMDWRARLRPFRYPTGGTASAAEQDALYRAWLEHEVLPQCEGACSDVLDVLAGANDALH